MLREPYLQTYQVNILPIDKREHWEEHNQRSWSTGNHEGQIWIVPRNYNLGTGENQKLANTQCWRLKQQIKGICVAVGIIYQFSDIWRWRIEHHYCIVTKYSLQFKHQIHLVRDTTELRMIAGNVNYFPGRLHHQLRTEQLSANAMPQCVRHLVNRTKKYQKHTILMQCE